MRLMAFQGSEVECATLERTNTHLDAGKHQQNHPCGAYVALQTPADAQMPPTALAVDFHDLRTHTLLGEAF